jgi:hypothetical protein
MILNLIIPNLTNNTYGATRLGSPHPGPLSQPGALPRQPLGRHVRADLVSYGHLTFFFPGTGRSTATLLASAGGAAAVSKGSIGISDGRTKKHYNSAKSCPIKTIKR